MVVTSAFDLGEIVRIKDLNCTGRVVTIRITGQLWTEYEVGYFHDGKKEFAWMFEDELESASKERVNGADASL